MWWRNTVVFTTLRSDAPSASSRPFRLARAWRTSALIPPSTKAPSARPIWPETTSQSPARTTGVYGPTGVLRGRRLGLAKGGAATARAGGVGVVDGEPGALEPVLVVERRAPEVRGAGRVDDDLDATSLGDVVVGGELAVEEHLVAVTRAA